MGAPGIPCGAGKAANKVLVTSNRPASTPTKASRRGHCFHGQQRHSMFLPARVLLYWPSDCVRHFSTRKRRDARTRRRDKDEVVLLNRNVLPGCG